jgi:hypothetical protein
MNRNEFLELLTRFAVQPIPSTLNRHVYLWVGETDELISASPPGLIKKLDLHVLCKEITRTPLGDKAAGRELSDAIDEWIISTLAEDLHQQALLVTGIDILYRYHMPLSAFFRRANEKNMVIFSLSPLDIGFRPVKSLPSIIQFYPDAILKYASSEIPEEAIVKED